MLTETRRESSSPKAYDSDEEFSLYLARTIMSDDLMSWDDGRCDALAKTLAPYVHLAREERSPVTLMGELRRVAKHRFSNIDRKAKFIARFVAGEAHLPRAEELDQIARNVRDKLAAR